MSLAVRRIYDEPGPEDGLRILVDRLWPRGLSKDRARVDHWFREVAPSDDLRRWFGHDPARWDGFVERYHAELDANPATARLRAVLDSAERATLLFATREERYNNAVALAAWLARD